MRQSILFKVFIILVSTAAIGGAVFVGFRHASDVRGSLSPLSPRVDLVEAFVGGTPTEEGRD